jgi:hypothetical protein
MDPELFRDHVRSFEFWFGAVQGYLEGTSYGHRLDTPEPAPPTAHDALVRALQLLRGRRSPEGAGA